MVKFSQERNSRCVFLFYVLLAKVLKIFLCFMFVFIEGSLRKKSQDTEIAVLFFFNLRNFDPNT